MCQKRIFTYILLPVFVLSAGSCGSMRHSGKSQDLMPGTWQSQPISIDGDSKDWPSPYPNYDAKAMVAYATSNDRENLYITMETGDELTQVKILKQGMTIYIDTTGKKEQPYKINYPLPNEDDLADMLQPADKHGKDAAATVQLGRQMQQKLKKSAEGANQFSLEGFKSCNGGYLVSQTSPCGIKVKLKIDEYKQLVWEAVVPFKSIYNKETITDADAGRPISVCFAVKGFKSPGGKNITDNTGGANNGMGGGGMAGGGRSNSRPIGAGSGRGSTTDPMQHLYESTKTWKRFSIVTNPK